MWTRRPALAGIIASTRLVRVRITLVATLVVGLAMIIGTAVLLVILRELLAEEVGNAARVRSTEIAAAAEAGSLPSELLVDDPDDEAIQVFGRDGIVIASTSNVAGMPALARPRPDKSVEIDGPIGDHPLIVAATVANAPAGVVTVVVALSLEPVTEATEVVTQLLAMGSSLLLLLIAAVTWALVGRALAPVEAIRNEVDAITSAELHRRVPDPFTDDEIGRLAGTMNRMLDRVEQGHLRQRQFVSDASHELRTPVAVIRQHAEIALTHPDRSNPAELAATVLAEDLRIQRLIEDLLLLARSDELSLQLSRVPVDLDDIVFCEARRLRSTTDLTIDTTAVSAGQITGDAAALHRVLRNIGENASRHARGLVAFALIETDGHVVLTVDDDGRGIPAADRHHVLERFVRLDAARGRNTGGSGLGLSIVAELVEEHGGSLEITTSAAGGARIRIRFPCALADR